MADEQLTSEVGTSQEAPSTEQAQETSSEQPQSEQPTQTEETPKVNLFDSDEFKKWQATQTRQIQQLQQRAARAEQAAKQAQMAGMDDMQKLQFERDELRQQVQAAQQQMEYQRLEAQKNQDIAEIIAETGVPREVIEGAENVYDAWKLASRYATKSAKEQAKMLAKAEKEKAENNAVDLGGGAASTPSTRWDDKAKDLIKSKDASGFIKHYLSGANR
jgi:hypothetical protein